MYHIFHLNKNMNVLQKQTSVRHSPKKILIVEDDEELAEEYRLAFSQKGFEVEVSTTGIGGLEKVVAFWPDVILLDLVLPEIDGHQIMKTIRKTFKTKAKVLVWSNYDSKENIEKSFQCGADAFLPKRSFTPEKMIERVEIILKKPSQE